MRNRRARAEEIEPVFLLTLDTELAWGIVGEKDNPYSMTLSRMAHKTRRAIDSLLRLLERYRIPATWAVVGHLLLEHCGPFKDERHPELRKPKGTPIEFDPCSDESVDPLFYAYKVIGKIVSSETHHEIGYHSFSHVLFDTVSRDVAESEIEVGRNLAKELGLELKSFVFPQNRVAHLDVLHRYGFRCFRSETLLRSEHTQPWTTRYLGGAMDKLIARPTRPFLQGGLVGVPGSMMFFDPHVPTSLLPRALIGLKRAILASEVFHVFLHPQNLLYSELLLPQLEMFLARVARNRERGRITVMTMGELPSNFGLD
jgi:peptidoglycan/xylan/chitin deacetylase (PgdA/CDA1 family)